jgi:hypothetical protein
MLAEHSGNVSPSGMNAPLAFFHEFSSLDSFPDLVFIPNMCVCHEGPVQPGPEIAKALRIVFPEVEKLCTVYEHQIMVLCTALRYEVVKKVEFALWYL